MILRWYSLVEFLLEVTQSIIKAWQTRSCHIICVMFVIFCIHLGTLASPESLNIYVTSNTLILSWIVPSSRTDVSPPPLILYHTLANNITNVSVNISTSNCSPSMPCSASLDLSDPSLIINNTSILEYNHSVEFKLFAVNGAGKGNATIYVLNHTYPCEYNGYRPFKWSFFVSIVFSTPVPTYMYSSPCML